MTQGFYPPAAAATGGAVGSAAMLDANGLVATDVLCRQCSYNLRGLPATGHCPECGTPVGTALRGTLLRYSNPEWVGMLAGGVRRIIWGIVVFILGAFVVAIVSGVMGLGQIPAVVVSTAGYALMVWGAWMLTEPDPSGAGEDHYGTARKVIRVCLLFGVVSHLLNFVQQVAPLPAPVALMFAVVGLVAGIAGVVGMFAQLQYLGKLAVRIPDEKLAGRAGFLKVALGVSYGLLVLMGGIIVLAAALSGPQGARGVVGPVGCGVGIVGLAALVFGIMYLLMLEKMGKKFREEGEVARLTWASLTGAVPMDVTAPPRVVPPGM